MFRFFLLREIPVINHEVNVNIAIPGMAEGGNLDSVALLEGLGKVKEVHESAARDGDVLVQFAQAGSLEGVGEGSP